ncbi:UPF0738 family protein [Priestia endophytica]|uniref:Uncharacterized protein n=1 Tax=Priestia endophytica DSM 13796 TaxID=1121089 RepID=A0A1I6AV82_9BACI|nr:hypothetical protein [Priestia endophytica]KYG31180.1 hypothetical protein AZF06_05370 [Priestia endophytica]SFQ72539.1 hypothetical protein SAMN02745910_03036 [Priestia endophytica DSM 13796]
MSNRIEVNGTEWKEGRLYIKTEALNQNIETIEDTGQMIVDSDNLSFIYIIDVNEAFVYVSITESYWNNIKEAKENNANVVALVGEHEVQLENIFTELEDLVENIEGNSNYGEEFMGSVEKIFLNKA